MPRAVAVIVLLAGVACAVAEDADLYDVLPKPSRDARRKLESARLALDEGRYNRAIADLQAILDGDADDGFLPPAAGSSTPVTLRREAARVLGAMPPEGRAWYELQMGGRAQTMLEQAVRRGDGDALARVGDAYFLTKAGREAILLSARDHLDHGRPLEAIRRLRRLDASPATAAAHEPEAVLLSAIAWIQAGEPDEARRAVAGYAGPATNVQLAGRSFVLPRDRDAVFRALSALGESALAGREAPPDDWPVFRGSAARNAPSDWSGRLGERAWTVPADDEQTEALRDGRADWGASDAAPIPAQHPILVGRTVVVRTPSRVLGIEWETGCRVWEYPWDSGENPSARFGMRQDRSSRLRELQRRVWDEGVYGQLASDGRRVFFVERPDTPAVQVFQAPNGRQVIFRAAGILGMANLVNRLVALDLEREGALTWAVGGPRGDDEPRLAGTFFLGPPLVAGRRLFVLAEVEGEIVLCALDSARGRLEWSQAIAHPREHPMLRMPRQQAGLTPSAAGGLVVCPTSAGAVVAVEPSTGALAWAYVYRRSEAFAPRSLRTLRRGSVPPPSLSGRDASATIAGRYALVAPVDSDQVCCLDLLCGEELWSGHRGSGLMIGCAYEGKAILVGAREVAGLRLADRGPAWDPPSVSLPGDGLASGRGLRCGRYYYVPTTAKMLVEIDLDRGRIERTVPTSVVLGNLVGQGDELLSQSADSIDRFVWIDDEGPPK